MMAIWKYTLPLAIGAGMLTAVLMWDSKRIGAAKQQGRQEVVIASKRAGEDANAKATKARAAAATPGASDRLRKDPAVCRDCGP